MSLRFILQNENHVHCRTWCFTNKQTVIAESGQNQPRSFVKVISFSSLLSLTDQWWRHWCWLAQGPCPNESCSGTEARTELRGHGNASTRRASCSARGSAPWWRETVSWTSSRTALSTSCRREAIVAPCTGFSCPALRLCECEEEDTKLASPGCRKIESLCRSEFLWSLMCFLLLLSIFKSHNHNHNHNHSNKSSQWFSTALTPIVTIFQWEWMRNRNEPGEWLPFYSMVWLSL